MFQVFQTPEGVARADGDKLALLQGISSLDEVIRANGVAELGRATVRETAPMTALPLEAPVRAERFFIIGLNYVSHAREVGQPDPAELIFGSQIAADSQSAPGAKIAIPAEAPDQLDYEGEIAVVIGGWLDDASPDQASAAIAGVAAAIDLSARDVQMAALRAGGPDHPGVIGSKMFTGFKPIGPGLIWIDAQHWPAPDLALSTHVNGELRQSANARNLVFSIPECLSRISKRTPLKPGDVVLTGTPAGVGFVKGAFLRPGDVVSVSVGALPPLTVSLA
jgi:2-keto-4-pentenoate hydratase/2-oxohepta-3-ene-1,7-dioic acid hydratase in catechol pathway